MGEADPKPDAAGRSRAHRALAERVAFVLFAGGLTLWVACRFYASMRLQILYTSDQPLASAADWSAPLDDVFIHFDFARAIARGHPFEWSEGNGYSSGGTSMLYPFVLALGYWLGFRNLSLMIWAAVVACTCTFALLWASRRLFRDLPRFTSYVAPVAVLGIGVLDWTLFSGMEVAFFLALWGGALVAWDDLLRGVPGGVAPQRKLAPALWLGTWAALLVATRPESAVVVAAFSLSAGLLSIREHGWRAALGIIAVSALPAVLVLLVQAIANKLLTGDSSAAGALVKLEMHHPYLSAQQVRDAWWFHVKYQLLRVVEYHLTDAPGFGWIPLVLGLFALIPRATRRYAALLWASAIAWVLMVALNGQVRWQNERYTMPALAWVMLSAALGIGSLIGQSFAEGRRGRVLRIAAGSVVLGSVALFAWHHAPKFRDQVWFFGRASRNIRDQHIRTGRLLRNMLPSPPRRVLVGDAGAVPYAADIPAFDIIGLGGYRGLPLARATRQSVGAAVELIERMPAKERPDMFAVYPSWWGVFPMWFGRLLAEVPVSGNVICGGAAKVLYQANWDALEGSAQPGLLGPGEVVVDALDPADLVSEREHAYQTSVGVPYVEQKLLAHPRVSGRDLFDAGRILPEGASATFELAGLDAGRAARLLLRVAPVRPASIAVEVNGRALGDLELDRSEGWVETPFELPADVVSGRVRIGLTAKKGEHVLYHLWAIQAR